MTWGCLRALAGPSLRTRALAATLALSAGGVALVQQHEGTVRRVYLDPAKIPTVCTGHTGTVTHKDLGKTFTPERCAELLRQDLRAAGAGVKRAVRVPLTQGQYDVLTSFTFNVGEANLRGSTLVRKLNAGDCLGAAREFDRWVYARGQKLPGLVTRRAEERKIFEEGCQ